MLGMLRKIRLVQQPLPLILFQIEALLTGRPELVIRDVFSLALPLNQSDNLLNDEPHPVAINTNRYSDHEGHP